MSHDLADAEHFYDALEVEHADHHWSTPCSRVHERPSSPARDSWIGETIAGRYRIVAKRAEGGMGHIYIAEHLELETRVAIKLLPFSDHPEYVERFRREARAMSRLRSPHITPAFDFGQLDDGSFFFAMELLVGEDLSSTLAREGVLEAERTVRILRQVANALDAAHALGFVHRDLKPDNIFLVADVVYEDFVKVLDFGIAKQIVKKVNELTAAGSLLGTPGYMAPEQVRSESVSAATDVYALAAVAFEMLTGELPHREQSLFQMLEALLSEPARAPSDVGLHIDGLDALMQKALARDPGDRHSSAGTFVDELEQVLLGTTTRWPSPARSVVPEAPWEPEPTEPASLPAAIDPPEPPASEAAAPTEPATAPAPRWRLAAALAVALLVGLVLGSFLG